MPSLCQGLPSAVPPAVFLWAPLAGAAPAEGAALLADPGSHILLLHAHDETDAMVPGYYRLFIDYLLEKGVVFDVPEFIRL